MVEGAAGIDFQHSRARVISNGKFALLEFGGRDGKPTPAPRAADDCGPTQDRASRKHTRAPVAETCHLRRSRLTRSRAGRLGPFAIRAILCAVKAAVEETVAVGLLETVFEPADAGKTIKQIEGLPSAMRHRCATTAGRKPSRCAGLSGAVARWAEQRRGRAHACLHRRALAPSQTARPRLGVLSLTNPRAELPNTETDDRLMAAGGGPAAGSRLRATVLKQPRRQLPRGVAESERDLQM